MFAYIKVQKNQTLLKQNIMSRRKISLICNDRNFCLLYTFVFCLSLTQPDDGYMFPREMQSAPLNVSYNSTETQRAFNSTAVELEEERGVRNHITV